jgi:hypothetical protein
VKSLYGWENKAGEIEGTIRKAGEERSFHKEGDSTESGKDAIESVRIQSQTSNPGQEKPSFF